MNLACDDALPLVPAYVDGELSEAQAGLLRKHLLECPACRGAVQDGRALQRWFAAERESVRTIAGSAVPPGFAARVARRAFAGDKGEHGLASAIDADGHARESAPEREEDDREAALRFVLQLTSIAAAALIALSIGMRLQELPSGHLRADDRALVSLEELQRECERIERAEKGLPALPAEAEAHRPRSSRPGPEAGAPGASGSPRRP